MDVGFVGILISLGGLFLTMLALYYKVSKDTENSIDEKVQSIWKKVDENKDHSERRSDKMRREFQEDYVPVKMCKLIHVNNDKVLAEIKNTLDEIVKELKAMNEREIKRLAEK